MNLEKMIITAYKRSGDGNGKSTVDHYSVMINPASLNISKKIDRNDGEKPHGKQQTSSLGSFKADTLSFELFLDSTGLLSKVTYVQEKVQEFERLAYNFQTETHQSNFLEIKWGEKFVFRGYLTSLQINYTLFDSSGNALRAKLNVTFEGYIPPAKFEKNPGQNSPDKTHLRFPNQSDTIANYCSNIYGDPKYLIQVARHNKLLNFRKLKAGKRLEFPPLINKK